MRDGDIESERCGVCERRAVHLSPRKAGMKGSDGHGAVAGPFDHRRRSRERKRKRERELVLTAMARNLLASFECSKLDAS